MPGHLSAAMTASTLLLLVIALDIIDGSRDLLLSDTRGPVLISSLHSSTSGLCSDQLSSSRANWENNFFIELALCMRTCHAETGKGQTQTVDMKVGSILLSKTSDLISLD